MATYNRLRGSLHKIPAGAYAENSPFSLDLLARLAHNEDLISDGCRHRHLVNEWSQITGNSQDPDGSLVRTWGVFPVIPGLEIECRVYARSTLEGGAAAATLYLLATPDLLHEPWTDPDTDALRHWERWQGTPQVDTAATTGTYAYRYLSVRPSDLWTSFYLSLWATGVEAGEQLSILQISAVERRVG